MKPVPKTRNDFPMSSIPPVNAQFDCLLKLKALSFKRQSNWALTGGMLLMGKSFLVLGTGFINQMTQEHLALWL